MSPLTSAPHLPTVAVVVVMLAGAAVMIAWRLRETSTPVSLRKIVAPPLGMSTGFLMFVAPAARVSWAHAGAAFAAGALVLAIPLARTSRLVRRGDEIVMQRSRAFLWILLGLVAVRFVAREYVERVFTQLQTGAIFFILAFGMIVRWRVAMLREYLRLRDGVVAAGPAGDGRSPA
jgi:membrane protein CcdC involved in cytochrome C biogenesis